MSISLFPLLSVGPALSPSRRISCRGSGRRRSRRPLLREQMRQRIVGPRTSPAPAWCSPPRRPWAGCRRRIRSVTLTLTPVALVKASASPTKSSSSDCTSFQRSSASCAPFSGFHGAASPQAPAHSSRGGPASAPVAARAPCTRVRRFNVCHDGSSLIRPWQRSPLGASNRCATRGSALSRSCRRLEIVAFAEDGDNHRRRASRRSAVLAA